MKDLKNVKFITEDNQEYVILFNKTINSENCGYAVNLNDESDAMCVRILEDQDGYFFDIIEDASIIKQILNLK